MLVERVNRHIIKGLKIMTNEHGSIRVALEAILLLIYAWNSCPIPGTDISRSLVAVGRKFAFPINYSAGKHWELVSSPSTVTTYSKDLALCLTAFFAIAELLVKEHRAYHRKFLNANCSNPRVYAVGDIVFARQAFRSDAWQECVNKLQYAFTERHLCPTWRVLRFRTLQECRPEGQETCRQPIAVSPRIDPIPTSGWC
jgi:hypothetical protein